MDDHYFVDEEELNEELDQSDVYDSDFVDGELEEDRVSSEEAAFMQGYIDALM